jgi:formylglycine-generating enzyme required for sulfatase activity
MASFDPYHKWLAIPPEEQPPNHYRLLALPLFEWDADVIDAAAEQRTVFLRSFQTGTNAELAERLLNEVSEARVCLLDGKSKARYDTQLKASQQPAQPVAEETVPEEAPVPLVTPQRSVVSKRPSTRTQSRRRPAVKPLWQQPWVMATAGALVLLLIVFNLGGDDQKPSGSPRGTTASKIDPKQKPKVPNKKTEKEQQAELERLAAEKAAAEEATAKAAMEKLAAEKADAKVAAEWAAVAVIKKQLTPDQRELSDPIVNSIGMLFVPIPAGHFQMGERDNVHQVTLTKPFYLGAYEVTQAQYENVIGKNPTKKKGADYPVSNVSWTDSMGFCLKLSEQEGVKYRLPTEAEWEYACRAGTTTVLSYGKGKLGDYAWYRTNAWNVGKKYAQRVGQKKPNPWGLYDMHGNLWEWCQDWYGSHPKSSVTDPQGPLKGSRRVLKSASFGSYSHHVRSAARKGDVPSAHGSGSYGLGFRVVRELQ